MILCITVLNNYILHTAGVLQLVWGIIGTFLVHSQHRCFFVYVYANLIQGAKLKGRYFNLVNQYCILLKYFIPRYSIYPVRVFEN